MVVNKGFVGLKLDMSKAYDSIEWPLFTGCLAKHLSVIMNCISIVSFYVHLNVYSVC